MFSFLGNHYFCCRLIGLQKLERLRLGNSFKPGFENKFKAVPSAIPFLMSLKELDFPNVLTLESLDRGLLNLPCLETLDCSRCENLRSPPYAVCEQGLHAVKKYYMDMEKEDGRKMPTISAAVIGEKMAGKTSLIWTLQKQERMLTYRNAFAAKDDTTEAFNVEEVLMGDYSLKVFDFGGHKVYHIAYQLIIRKNYIPVVVINMAEFDRISNEQDSKKAASQLCMDFMSQLYLSCPKLGPPILVLTHRDHFDTQESFERSKDKLLNSVEELRKEFLREEKLLTRDTRILPNILHFVDVNKPLFKVEDIFVFSKWKDEAIILALRAALELRCCVDDIPRLWEEMSEFFEQMIHKLYLTLEDLRIAFPGDEGHYILRYMHNVGKVLWFEREPKLQNYVFHRIDVITKFITLFYHHRSDSQWEAQIQATRPYRFQDEIISIQRYKSLVKSFQKTGILDKAVLSNLYARNKYPADIALHLLQTFYLVCGPIGKAPRETFILPYFSEEVIRSPLRKHILLKIEICFVGLTPPSYINHLLTVVYLNMFTNPIETYRMRVGQNGAEVYHGTTVSRVLHDKETRSISVQIDTDVKNLADSWKQIMLIVDNMLEKALQVWVAARAICRFFCAHCTITGERQPEIMEDPDWYKLPDPTGGKSSLASRLAQFLGKGPVPCCNDGSHDGSLIVPMALRFPCELRSIIFSTASFHSGQ